MEGITHDTSVSPLRLERNITGNKQSRPSTMIRAEDDVYTTTFSPEPAPHALSSRHSSPVSLNFLACGPNLVLIANNSAW